MEIPILDSWSLDLSRRGESARRVEIQYRATVIKTLIDEFMSKARSDVSLTNSRLGELYRAAVELEKSVMND